MALKSSANATRLKDERSEVVTPAHSFYTARPRP